MKFTVHIGSLRLTDPLNTVVFRTLGILVLLIAAGEIAARSPAVQSQLDLPMVSGDSELGPKIFLADRLMAEEGHIDCFAIGNSTVVSGIEAEAFNQGYQAAAGSPMRCFNFGLNGLTIDGSKRLLRILVERYHPRVILVGLHFKNFTVSNQNLLKLKIPWTRAVLEGSDFQGEVEDRSMLYRYFLTYVGLSQEVAPQRYSFAEMSAWGYVPDDAVFDLGSPFPDWAEKDLKRTISGLDIVRFRVGLNELLKLSTPGTQVVLVAMPVPQPTIDVYNSTGRTFNNYRQTLIDAANRHHVVFIAEPPDSEIPSTGYKDVVHLNTSGAGAFSAWLGGQVGKLAHQGTIHTPSSTAAGKP